MRDPVINAVCRCILQGTYINSRHIDIFGIGDVFVKIGAIAARIYRSAILCKENIRHVAVIIPGLDRYQVCTFGWHFTVSDDKIRGYFIQRSKIDICPGIHVIPGSAALHIEHGGKISDGIVRIRKCYRQSLDGLGITCRSLGLCFSSRCFRLTRQFGENVLFAFAGGYAKCQTQKCRCKSCSL